MEKTLVVGILQPGLLSEEPESGEVVSHLATGGRIAAARYDEGLVAEAVGRY